MDYICYSELFSTPEFDWKLHKQLYFFCLKWNYVRFDCKESIPCYFTQSSNSSLQVSIRESFHVFPKTLKQSRTDVEVVVMYQCIFPLMLTDLTHVAVFAEHWVILGVFFYPALYYPLLACGTLHNKVGYVLGSLLSWTHFVVLVWQKIDCPKTALVSNNHF